MKVAKIRGFCKSCNAGRPTKIYLVMRLTALFLLAACLDVQGHGYSQGKLSLAEKDVPLPKVFQAIERQSDYHFFYDYPIFAQAAKVSVDMKDASIEQVLNVCFKNQPFSYSIEGKLVLVKRKEMRASVVGDTHPSTSFDIRGRVTDSLGRPLVGASVQIKGTNKGLQTDANGGFEIKELPENAVLLVSFAGYTSREISVATNNFLSIVLLTAVNPLDEVQIIGYGTTTQRLYTGDISKVSGKEIEEQPVANPLSALEGRMTGVFIQSGQGLPGTSITVQVRGLNSIAGGNNPLFIVDGVPFGTTPLNSWNGSLIAANGNISPFNSINPSDIESIEVLKDADATAIYGSRGSNGVILITTKKGKAGKTKFDVNVYTGQDAATHLVKSLSTPQYLQIKREAFANDGVTPTIANAPQITLFDTTKYTNWQKFMLGNTPSVTNAQMTISGGNLNTRFLLGGSYRNEGVIFPGNIAYHRGGVHFNMEHTSPDSKFYVSLNSIFTSDKNNDIAQTIASVLLAPDQPLYDSTGALNFIGGGNPLAMLKQYSYNQTNNLVSSVQLRYNLLPGWNIKTSLGYSYMAMNTLLTYPDAAQNPANNPVSKADYGSNAVTTYIIEPQTTYQRAISSGKLEALIGGTWQYNVTDGYFIQGQNYSNDALLQNLGAAGSISTAPGPATNYLQYKYISAFSRVNYNWSDKYIIDASFRRDGSSRFGPGKEFGNFGAGGAAWLFSNENFVSHALSFLSYGKIRASYGVVGNDQIADYQYLATYSSSLNYQGISGLAPSRIANPDYSWELNRKLEAAIELGFFKDRILLSAIWYRNRSSNELVGYPLPSQTGFTSYQANLPALVQNTGWEYSLNTINVKSKDFTWSSSFNISFLNNKLLSFPGLASSSYSNTYVIGKSISLVKGYHFVRVDPQTGIPQFSTVKGADTLSPSYATDRVVMGKTMPNYFGGLNNTVTYKKFEFGFLLQFVKQQGSRPDYWPGVQNFMTAEALKRWQKPGDITNVPKATTLNANNASSTAYSYFLGSDRFWGDASYLRLKNVTIAYNLPKETIAKLKIDQCRFYVQGQNLLTFTRYPGSDPEVPGGSYIVPVIRIITGGIQITF